MSKSSIEEKPIIETAENKKSLHTELKEKDIITSIDGKEINSMNSLREYIYTKKPGDIIQLEISRGKINKAIKITLR